MCDDGPEQVFIQNACAGDEVALKVLLARSRPGLCDYVSRKTPGALAKAIDPEDIVQDAHIAIFQRIGTLRSNRLSSFHRWVKAIALNRLRNVIKQHRSAKRGERVTLSSRKRSVEDSTYALFNMLAAPGRTPSRSVARGEAINAVQAAIADLPQHYQRAVRLVHIDGCTIREAALEMGRTERAVHGLCRRALKRLQKRLVDASRFLSSTG
jgi:RNA polymerase sigma-70 factor (ECF subfamily)